MDHPKNFVGQVECEWNELLMEESFQKDFEVSEWINEEDDQKGCMKDQVKRGQSFDLPVFHIVQQVDRYSPAKQFQVSFGCAHSLASSLFLLFSFPPCDSFSSN